MSDFLASPFVYFIWAIIGATVAWGAYLTLDTKTGKLSTTAQWLVFGIIMTWVSLSVTYFLKGASFFTPGNNWYQYPAYFLSYSTIMGGLIHVQSLYQWKFGRWAWFKIFFVASVCAGLMVEILKYLF